MSVYLMAKSAKKSTETEPPSEIDLAEAFDEELKKPYYDALYLDNFKLPYDKLDVSIIIPTYNRCPIKPETLRETNNPLFWALTTIFMQKPRIKEVIVVDDCGEDYTEEVVNSFREKAKELEIKLHYIKNEKRQGPGVARNIGAKQASSKYLFFLDDDIFLSPYATFGAVYTFEKLKEKGLKVGIINLATYSRSSIPRKTLEKSKIGEISFLKGTYSSNKDAFPSEYLTFKGDEKFMDSELNILNPFSILNVNAIMLVPKTTFEEVEGFSTQAMKRMEDRDFGCRVIDNGYSVYFIPDPKFHCVHGSYGLHTRQKFYGDDWFKKLNKSISIKKAMDICDDPKEDNGARVDANEYIHQSILSFFFLTYFRNKKGAINWIKKVYEEFVIDGETGLFGNVNIPTPGENDRKKIWMDAINEGLGFIKKEEISTIEKINHVVDKLHHKEESSKEVLGLMENL